MTTIDPVWSTRRNAIDTCINSFQQDIAARLVPANSATREGSRLAAIQSILNGLQQYGFAKFDYFLNEFGNDRLQPSNEHPAEEVLRVTLEQMAFDLDVIYRAADPRVMSCGPKSTMDPTLAKADDLVCSALQPAISSNLLDGPITAITYYQKSPFIRSIPYASAALIAVPYNCSLSARDFLSIPHEVGHYVFRNGHRPAGVTLPGSTRRLANYCEKWCEEIFADVYGCLVAGPIMALDFQDLQHADSGFDLIYDDGRHPVSGLRPYAYNDILRHLPVDLSAWAQTLDSEWSAYLQTRRFDVQVDGAPADNVIKIVGFDTVHDEVKEAIRRFFIVGLDRVPVSQWGGIAWPTTVPDICRTIYAEFESNMNNLPLNDSPQCYQPATPRTWAGPRVVEGQVATKDWLDAWLNDGWTSLPTEQNWLPK